MLIKPSRLFFHAINRASQKTSRIARPRLHPSATGPDHQHHLFYAIFLAPPPLAKWIFQCACTAHQQFDCVFFFWLLPPGFFDQRSAAKRAPDQRAPDRDLEEPEFPTDHHHHNSTTFSSLSTTASGAPSCAPAALTAFCHTHMSVQPRLTRN